MSCVYSCVNSDVLCARAYACVCVQIYTRTDLGVQPVIGEEREEGRLDHALEDSHADLSVDGWIDG